MSTGPLIGDALERAALLYGDRVAIIDGAVRLSYRDVLGRVQRLAGALAELAPGAHVGILAANSFRYMEAYFAVHWSGMPLAPLNTRLTAAELEYIIDDGEIVVLLVDREHLDLARQITARVPRVRHLMLLDGEAPVGVHGYEDLLRGAVPRVAPGRDWLPDDMVLLCYTGGTTGRPKGVMLSHRNVVSNALHVVLFGRFDEPDRWLHVCPMFHAADAWACWAVSYAGGTHIFVPGFSAETFIDIVERERITVTLLVPTMINFVVNHPRAHEADFSSLRLLLFGASPMAVDRLLEAFRVFGPILCQVYGMTETSPFLTAQQLAWLDFESEAGRARLASCGREIPEIRVRVVDEQGCDVPAGATGEIVARGPNVMLGYWKQPEETARALAGGWMHTGDVAGIDAEGFITIVDRAKDMIITGAENVYSTEVEATLYQHPAVLEAAVIGIPDARWGEAVHAVVVLRDGQRASADELVAHCRQRIAGFKCPKSVTIQLEPLPKSGAGKVLKSELRKPFWEGRAVRVS